MSEFQKAVLSITRLIPTGRVMSYGQIAAYIGKPGAARQVGGALRSLDGTDNFPWWRVVNNSGRITIKGAVFANRQTQRELLQDEGVVVDGDMKLDIDKYRYMLEPAG